jgi:hypothetical protein
MKYIESFHPYSSDRELIRLEKFLDSIGFDPDNEWYISQNCVDYYIE